MKMLEVRHVSKSFGGFQVIKDISFDLKDKDFLTVLGPSGCGKSTLLNIIVGTTPCDSGEIILEKENVTGKINGKFSYMQQKDLLLPWRNVFDNLKLVAEVNNNIENVKSIIEEYLTKVNLIGFEKFYPYQLSGGMLKRVALARTLLFCKMHGANVILMDEPFSNLDAITRDNLELDLKKILKNEKKTTIFVTHDIHEAISLSDEIMLLSQCPAEIHQTFNVRKSNKQRLQTKIINNMKMKRDK